ncbi:MAG: tyrosine-type recombinase/integrase [Pseudonocardiaceae bacterium]
MRHSRAMHLYDGGVPLPYIRDILGHVDLSTTEIYANSRELHQMSGNPQVAC